MKNLNIFVYHVFYKSEYLQRHSHLFVPCLFCRWCVYRVGRKTARFCLPYFLQIRIPAAVFKLICPVPIFLDYVFRRWASRLRIFVYHIFCKAGYLQRNLHLLVPCLFLSIMCSGDGRVSCVFLFTIFFANQDTAVFKLICPMPIFIDDVFRR